MAKSSVFAAVFCQLMSETIKNRFIRVMIKKYQMRWTFLPVSKWHLNRFLDWKLCTGPKLLSGVVTAIVFAVAPFDVGPFFTWSSRECTCSFYWMITSHNNRSCLQEQFSYKSVILYTNYYTVKLCYTFYDWYNNMWNWDTSAVLHTCDLCWRWILIGTKEVPVVRCHPHKKNCCLRKPTGKPQLENGPQHRRRSRTISFHHFLCSDKSPKRYKLIISNKTGSVRIP